MKNEDLEKIGDILESDSAELYDEDDLALLKKYPEALMFLVDGYVNYSSEVIKARAIPGIDGLKPVQRRILYTMWKANLLNSRTNKMKCAKICGQVMTYHPHSDEPIYQAMVKLVDRRNGVNFPLVNGEGSFGKVYSKNKAAAKRYTEAKLSSNAQEFFGNMKGVEYVNNFDDTEVEPELLPISFPSILVNGTQGVAVGLASNIPSFNLEDVCDLVIEYIEKGACESMIVPDFPSGGTYVYNEKELMSIMKRGKGSIKLRGNYRIEGKEIIFSEIPYGTFVEALKEKILKLNLDGLSDARNLSDKRGLTLSVSCQKANKALPLVYGLFRDTDLQTSITANMTVIIDNQPKLLGVWGIIEEWVKFRRKVLVKQFEYECGVAEESLEEIVAQLKFFRAGKEVIDEYVRLMRFESKEKAKSYILNTVSDLKPEEYKFIRKLILESLSTESIKALENTYRLGLEKIEAIKDKIKNVDNIIVKEMNDIKIKYANMCVRKTQITYEDFVFSKTEEKKTVDTSDCIVAYEGGFLRKLSPMYKSSIKEYMIECRANDVLIAVDNRGRILRVYLEELEYSGARDTGTYLPNYWGISENDLHSLEVLRDKEKMVLYSDGKVGFIDYSEWTQNNRRVRVIETGVSTANADKILDVFDTPDSVLIVTKKGKISICDIADINKKRRTGRTSVFKVDADDSIIQYRPMNDNESEYVLYNQYKYKAPDVMYLQDQGDLADKEGFIYCG